MQTGEIVQEIKRLPLLQRFYIIEETIRSIKKDEQENQIDMAVKSLYDDYANDKELTAFSSLDIEDFYQTK